MNRRFRLPGLLPIRIKPAAVPTESVAPQDRLRHAFAVPFILSLSLMLWNLLGLLLGER